MPGASPWRPAPLSGRAGGERNPFAHPRPTKEAQADAVSALEECVCALTLLPVRLAVLITTVVTAAAVCALCAMGLPDVPPGQTPPPTKGWRRFLVKTAIGLGARVVLFCLGFHTIRVRGAPLAPRKKAPCLVSNHQTFLDVCLWAYLLEAPVSVSAAENASLPVMGGIMRAAQCVFVDRDSKKSGGTATQQLTAVLTNDDFPRVAVYPEGNTSNGEQLTEFKLGAFLPMKPVQPAVITYATWRNRVNASWVEPLGTPIHVVALRLLSQPLQRLDVLLLPPMAPPKGAEPGDVEAARAFARRVRNAMADAAGLPTTEHNYTDTSLMLRAARAGAPDPAAFCIEAGRARDVLGPRAGGHQGLVAIAKKFLKANKGAPLDASALWDVLASPADAGDGDAWGWWGGADGLAAAGLSSPADALRAFDQTLSGAVSFRELVHGVAALTPAR